jgi:hypothetical protein
MGNERHHRKACRQDMKEEDILTQTTTERQITLKEHGLNTMIQNPCQRLLMTDSFLNTMAPFSRIIIKFQKD